MISSASAAAAIDPARLDALRRRTIRSLVAMVALGSVGYIATITTAAIAAEELAGSSLLAGLPGATFVLGAALGSAGVSAIMVRAGRRTGLATGFFVASIGAVVAAVAIIVGSFPLFLVGTLFAGVANSSTQLARYVGADLVPPSRRASTLAFIVWAITIGAVVGPNLAGPTGALAAAMGLPELAGPYLFPSLIVLGAAAIAFVTLRPDPYALADPSARVSPGDGEGDGLAALVRRPTVAIAMVALVAGQVVMVLVMTMTPLHLTTHGHGLTDVGIVISAHVFGMYALSPLSGRLTDRYGSPAVILVGLAIVGASAVLSAATPAEDGLLLIVPLFLIGFGWSLGFVAGSALLTRGLTLREGTRLQGATDALVWSSAAVASLTSGVIVAAASFAALGLLGAALVVVPIWVVAARRRTLATGTT